MRGTLVKATGGCAPFSRRVEGSMTLHAPPPDWLIRLAVAAVWLYEGVWCKLLGREPNQLRIVDSAPLRGPLSGAAFLRTLGLLELGVGLWALSGGAPVACAVAQTLLLASLNAGGLLWARGLIHDPPGMLVKNLSFLVLVWVCAALPPWS